jgi:hypothetical protein
MYGYHSKEKFAIDVGASLKELDSDNVLVRRYKGQQDYPSRVHAFTMLTRNPRFPKWNRFVKEYLPLDYVIDLHNGRQNAEWEKQFKTRYPNEPMPSMYMQYWSRHRINRRTQNEIYTLCTSQPYLALAFFISSSRYAPNKYDKIGVEFFPHLISKEQSTDLLKGLVKILSNRR